MSTPALRAPWRIEYRSTPFAPWAVYLGRVWTLDYALALEKAYKNSARCYSTRIRAN